MGGVVGSVAWIANAIAVFILAGMMLVPFLNILVGAVVGAGVGGFAGFFAGAAVAFIITAVEVVLMQNGPASETGERPQTSARQLGRAITNLADWRHLKRGLARTREMWADGDRRAA